jgi:hypothetical protein
MFDEMDHFVTVRINRTLPQFKTLYQQTGESRYNPNSDALLWEISRGIWFGLENVPGIKYAVSLFQQTVVSVYDIARTEAYGNLSLERKNEAFPIRIFADPAFVNRDGKRRLMYGPEGRSCPINKALTEKYRNKSVQGIPEYRAYSSPVLRHRF